jgi:NAD(P)-dependent dehydrogenase (short-subunit alcohol dehydrogenase family)
MGAGASTGAALGKRSTAAQVIAHFAAQRSVPASELLTGKTALVTGATSGIGLETAAALSSAGCRVLLGARSAGAGAQALAALASPAPAGGAAGRPSLCDVIAPLDLEDVACVRASAGAIAAALRGAPLDFVVLNAGIMALPALTHAAGGRGWEKQLATNHFGHHLLVSLLRPALLAQAPAPARVVFLSSLAHKRGVIDVDDLHFSRRKYDAWTAYGQSKLANMLDAKELSDQLAGSNVSACSVHPGVIQTNLLRHIPFLSDGGILAGAALAIMGPLVFDKTIPQGAATTLFGCLSPDAQGGVYLVDCAVAEPLTDAGRDADKSLRRALWQKTEEQVAAALATLDAQPAA